VVNPSKLGYLKYLQRSKVTLDERVGETPLFSIYEGVLRGKVYKTVGNIGAPCVGWDECRKGDDVYGRYEMNKIATKWDRRFLEMADLVASWSKDPSTQVGAVIVNDRKEVVGLGYNGFPRGVVDSADRLNVRETKYELVVHAEVNAILTAGDRARGCTLYVSPTLMVPNICPNCAKVAVQAGIKRVVGWQGETVERWQNMADLSRMLCEEGGIEMVSIINDN